jgi:addiction module HigA family antidote
MTEQFSIATMLGIERADIDPVVLANIHPGNILKLDYLPRMGVTEYRLAKLLGITQTHLAELLQGKRGVTANLSLRLGRVLGQPPIYWLNLQNHYDLLKAWQEYGDSIDSLTPFSWPMTEAAE